MTWSKFDDGWNDRPEVLPLSDAAKVAHLDGLLWCNRHLRDGVIPGNVPLNLIIRCQTKTPAEAVAELVEAGLWEVTYTVDDQGNRTPNGWQIEWTDQLDAKDVLAEREKWKRQKRHNKGDHSLCDPEKCWTLLGKKSTRDSTVESTSASKGPVPSRPVPTRPDPLPSRAEGKRDGSVVEDEGGAGSAARAPRSAGAPRGGGHTAGSKRSPSPRGGPSGHHRCGAPKISDGAPCQTAVGREGELCPHHRVNDPRDSYNNGNTSTHATGAVDPVTGKRVPPEVEQWWREGAHPFADRGDGRCSRCRGERGNVLTHELLPEGVWGSQWRASHPDDEWPFAEWDPGIELQPIFRKRAHPFASREDGNCANCGFKPGDMLHIPLPGGAWGTDWNGSVLETAGGESR